jgi:cardiolipin synthase
VKILLDAIGSSTIGNDILETLAGGGCQIAWYNPIKWYSIGRFNNRTHRKSLIIDGRVGFTGGAGIADQWLGHAQDQHHWRDMQIRIEGPAVTPLLTGFSQNWLERTHELVSGPMYYPALEFAGPHLALTLMSSPVTGASTVRIMYYLSIICARRTIWVANPYFVPDAPAIDTLIEARRRGVDVKVMVSGMNNDSWLSRQNSIRLYGRLLRAGVEIYEYHHTMLHHKTMVVDGVWATVGTTNFDNRSFAHNEETNVCFYDAPLVERMEETFREDLKFCARVDFHAWRHRGVWARGQEFVAAFLQEQV